MRLLLLFVHFSPDIITGDDWHSDDVNMESVQNSVSIYDV